MDTERPASDGGRAHADGSRYAWAEPPIQEMVSAITDVASALSTRRREAADYTGALWAAHRGSSPPRTTSFCTGRCSWPTTRPETRTPPVQLPSWLYSRVVVLARLP
ncbi:hypothetical protein GCM10010286_15200 [Streptomyces toxytricini]|nr:hypothetical protein GCM10010286_15200 [Streptomyces toxytricini]